MKLLLIQGANMEYLGRRQPELYGTTTAKELDAILRRQARRLEVTLDILYTNTEGEAVTAIYRADRAKIDGILFNPAGFLHAGHALRDCLRSRSEEHTSELQSQFHLVCRLLLEKKKQHFLYTLILQKQKDKIIK